jgi:hypothetical protein
MKLPKLLYGRYRDVRPRVARTIRRMHRRADWVEELSGDGFLDVDDTPGYVILDGPTAPLAAEDHFQMFKFWEQVYLNDRTLGAEIVDDVFDRSLTMVWGTLGVATYAGIMLFRRRRDRFAPFIRAVLTHWPTFLTLGPRSGDPAIAHMPEFSDELPDNDRSRKAK